MSFGQAGCSWSPSMMSGSPKSTKLDVATDNGTRATARKLSLILRSPSSDQCLVDMERTVVGGMVDVDIGGQIERTNYWSHDISRRVVTRTLVSSDHVECTPILVRFLGIRWMWNMPATVYVYFRPNDTILAHRVRSHNLQQSSECAFFLPRDDTYLICKETRIRVVSNVVPSKFNSGRCS